MRNEITEILRKYGDGEITREEANAELDKLDAGIHLQEKGEGGWTDQEMAEGFLPPAEEQPEKLPEGLDHSRHVERANLTVLQRTRMGTFATSYNEKGYAVKSVRVNV